MNRKFVYPLLAVMIVVGLYYVEQYVDKRFEAQTNSSNSLEIEAYSEFDESYLPSSTTAVIINHSYYSLSYSEAHEQAEWVAYELAKKHLSKNEIDRPDFLQDSKVKSKSAHWRNYKGSGYDRGHLCPAGDRRFSIEAYHETFLTSNISPQDNDFNGGVWNKLEQQVRFWAKKYDGVYVVTGGVLNEGLPTIGEERVSVPEDFYKIVLNRSGDEFSAIAFLIPNGPTNDSFYDYLVTIDEIEELTGIDFFPKLSEYTQKEFESKMDAKAWGER